MSGNFDISGIAFQIVATGDSITAGYPGPPTVQYPWTYYLNYAGLFPAVNVAVTSTGFQAGGSNSINSLGSTAVDPARTANTKLFLFSDMNDFVVNGDSAATIYGYFQTWLAARVAAGWSAGNIYVLMPIARTFTGYEAVRQAFITSVVGGQSSGHYNVVRLDQIVGFGFNGDQTNLTNYQSDQIHPTDAGQIVIANAVRAALK